MLKITIPSKHNISFEYFRATPDAIKVMTEIQHYRLGQGGDGFKIKGISERKGKGEYSAIYEPLKLSYNRPISYINFRLTGRFHRDLRFQPNQNYVGIVSTVPYLKNLLFNYPEAAKISNDSINIILRKRNEFNKTPFVFFIRQNLRKIISR